ncbi:MAG: signal peptidase I [Prevotella sp.]|nr:signal peptidase I [Prevotella sp.]
MRRLSLFAIPFLLAIVLMLVFRAVGMTVCTVEGDALSPQFIAGDRVLVNRWSYGLRIAGGPHFGYGRLWRQKVERGDLVAFDHPQTGEMLLCRCKGLPGDTLQVEGKSLVVPSLKACADGDYYWMESLGRDKSQDSRLLGFVAEEHIIGRVIMVVYSHHPDSSLWKGWLGNRFMKSY